MQVRHGRELRVLEFIVVYVTLRVSYSFLSHCLVFGIGRSHFTRLVHIWLFRSLEAVA